jgi:hypothetical protein
MKPYVLILLLLLLLPFGEAGRGLYAQNLVPNPSFESYTTCPTNFGQIVNSINWQAVISSPDYFNSCSSYSNISVPANFFNSNFQSARTGNGYAGFITLGLYTYNTRENISVPLISSLVNGNNYLVKFYVAAAQAYKLASNNIALNFSSTLTTSVSSKYNFKFTNAYL